MKLESILALAALIVSIYAIVPRDRRLSLIIKFGFLDWLIIIIAFLIIHYLQFYDFFRSINLSPKLGLGKWGITPHNATYIVVALTTIVIYLRLRTSKVSRKRIYKLRELIEELLRSDNHIVLISLLEKHINDISKIYKNDYYLSNLRWKFAPSMEMILKEIKEKGDTVTKKYSSRIYKIKCYLSKKLPSYSSEVECAHDIIRQLLLSHQFLHSLSKIRPYFFIKIAKKEFYENKDFISEYVKILLNDNSSILYYEIKDNQNISSDHRYYIDETNKMLFFLLKDAKIAEKLNIWKPFGDYIVSFLEDLARAPENDHYNQDMGNYYDEAKWKCPIFITVNYFDLMVTEALFQNIQWHMWLYYFPLFVKQIVDNYDPKAPIVNKASEWPTKYAYLIYHIISSMCSWVRAIRDLPPAQDNITLKSENTENENGNIPKSSILAMCRCIKYVVDSEKIPKEFKIYILDSVFSLYFDLKRFQHHPGYAVVLRKALFQGGEYYMSYNAVKKREYVECISDAFDAFDKIPYNNEDVREFQEIISHNN